MSTPKTPLQINREKLAAGAKLLQKAVKKPAATKAPHKPGEKKTPESTTAVPISSLISSRPILEVLTEYVTISKENNGVTVKKGVPIPEYLRLTDYFSSLESHVGFMLGDLMNAAENEHGQKYVAAMEATGRSYVTLRKYAMVAKSTPQNLRFPQLTFSHAAEAASLKVAGNQEKVLVKAAQVAKETGKAPKTAEIRAIVQKLEPKAPRKPKAAKTPPASSPAPSNPPSKPEPKATTYVPTHEEEKAWDKFVQTADELVLFIRDWKIKDLLLKSNPNIRKDFLKIVKPIIELSEVIESKI